MKVENYLKFKRDRDFDVKKGGMAGSENPIVDPLDLPLQI